MRLLPVEHIQCKVRTERHHMTQMVISLNETDATTPLQVDVHIENIHIEAEVLGSEMARRKANVWLLMNAGNLLRADHARLTMQERLLWEYDVLLTLPTEGTVGKIGCIRVDAKSGEVVSTQNLSDELIANANLFSFR